MKWRQSSFTNFTWYPNTNNIWSTYLCEVLLSLPSQDQEFLLLHSKRSSSSSRSLFNRLSCRSSRFSFLCFLSRERDLLRCFFLRLWSFSFSLCFLDDPIFRIVPPNCQWCACKSVDILAWTWKCSTSRVRYFSCNLPK